jgi:hypothetical protein
MPNWCENRMSIRGPIEKIEKFHRLVQRNGLVDTGVPMPLALDEQGSSNDWDQLPKSLVEAFPLKEKEEDDWGSSCWYEWANQYRGTKWDEKEMEMPEMGDIWRDPSDVGYAEIEYIYQSAWGPHWRVGMEIAYDWGFSVRHDYIEMDGCPMAGWLTFDFDKEPNPVIEVEYKEEDYDLAYEDPTCSGWMRSHLETWESWKKEWEEEEEEEEATQEEAA